MTDDSIHGLGPLFGPDFITIEIDDESKGRFALEIFPDANNPATYCLLLRACSKTSHLEPSHAARPD